MASLLSRLWQPIRSWFWVKAKRPYRWHWQRQAQHLPREQFLAMLAREVADDLLVSRPFGVTVAALVEGVQDCRASALQHEAEHFIENYYYVYPSTNPEFYHMLETFRRLVEGNLRDK